MRLNYYLLALVSICFFQVYAQDVFLPLNNELNVRYDELLASKNVSFIPTIRPYRSDELRRYIPFDSTEADITKHYYPNSEREKHSWLNRTLFSKHFVDVNDTADQFRLMIDPVLDVEAGHNFTTQARSETAPKTTYANTRGFQIQGDIGKNFLFYSSFYENQATFPLYVNNFVRQYGVVPGQGLVKGGVVFGSNSYDYALTTGGVSYTLNKHFNFTFANDKNFLGDGYRSLFLSDNSFTYPFLRITADIWRIRYVSINAVMQDPMLPHGQDGDFRKKYGTFHYFLLGVGKNNRLTLGLFEAVIWAYDTTRGRGFDLAYANPIIFLDPVQESMNSPDNSLIGFSVRYKLLNSLTLYSQILLDEFKLDEVRSGMGWWGNKQGVQIGFKSFNVAGVKHLSLQSEFNYVRPYTYSHVNETTNYAQFNQALADPLGANFMESVSFLRYNYKRWYLQAELMMALIGLDKDSLDYGSDIFISYNDRVQDYSNRVGQGLRDYPYA